MARLPQPGGDSGNWGDILNDYLLQVHDADGTLKDNVVTAATIAPGAVTKADVGLGNVDDTSDAAKPVSSATQTALNAKLDTADVDSEVADKISTDGTAIDGALTTSVDDKFANLLATYTPGAVQDFAERLVNFTTTNTTIGSTSATALIGGLEVTVVGTGRPVELTFFAGAVRHSVSNSYIGAYLVASEDGGADTHIPRVALTSTPGTSQAFNRSLVSSWDVGTVEGVEYVFKVGIYGTTGTTTIDTAPNYPVTFKARNH